MSTSGVPSWITSQISEQARFLKQLKAAQANGELAQMNTSSDSTTTTNNQNMPSFPPFDPAMMSSYLSQFLPNMMQPQMGGMMPPFMMAPMMMPNAAFGYGYPMGFAMPGMGQSVASNTYNQLFSQSTYLGYNALLLMLLGQMMGLNNDAVVNTPLPTVSDNTTTSPSNTTSNTSSTTSSTSSSSTSNTSTSSSSTDTSTNTSSTTSTTSADATDAPLVLTPAQELAVTILHGLEVTEDGDSDPDNDGYVFSNADIQTLTNALNTNQFSKADLGIALATCFNDAYVDVRDEYSTLISQLVSRGIIDPRHLFNRAMRDMDPYTKGQITEALGAASLLNANNTLNQDYIDYLVDTLETDSRDSVQILIKDLTYQYYSQVTDWSSPSGIAVNNLLESMGFQFDQNGFVIPNDPQNPFPLSTYYANWTGTSGTV